MQNLELASDFLLDPVGDLAPDPFPVRPEAERGRIELDRVLAAPATAHCSFRYNWEANPVVPARKRERPDKASDLVGGDQGRGRTADLPLFRGPIVTGNRDRRQPFYLHKHLVRAITP
jgi:hypothetical protein